MQQKTISYVLILLSLTITLSRSLVFAREPKIERLAELVKQNDFEQIKSFSQESFNAYDIFVGESSPFIIAVTENNVSILDFFLRTFIPENGPYFQANETPYQWIITSRQLIPDGPTDEFLYRYISDNAQKIYDSLEFGIEKDSGDTPKDIIKFYPQYHWSWLLNNMYNQIIQKQESESQSFVDFFSSYKGELTREEDYQIIKKIFISQKGIYLKLEQQINELQDDEKLLLFTEGFDYNPDFTTRYKVNKDKLFLSEDLLLIKNSAAHVIAKNYPNKVEIVGIEPRQLELSYKSAAPSTSNQMRRCLNKKNQEFDSDSACYEMNIMRYREAFAIKVIERTLAKKPSNKKFALIYGAHHPYLEYKNKNFDIVPAVGKPDFWGFESWKDQSSHFVMQPVIENLTIERQIGGIRLGFDLLAPPMSKHFDRANSIEIALEAADRDISRSIKRLDYVNNKFSIFSNLRKWIYRVNSCFA